MGDGNLKRPDLFLVGEAPGEREDYIHKPFQGRAGKLLDSILYAFDIGRERIFISNAVRCRPKDNAKPRSNQIAACNDYLRREIAVVNPRLVIAMGAVALESLTGHKQAVTTSRKRVHYVGKKKRPMIVTFHPAAALRNDYLTERIVEDFEYARRLLKNDFKEGPRESLSYVRVDRIPEEVFEASVVDVDLETDGLDPYIPGRKILSVQVTPITGKGYFLKWDGSVRKQIKELFKDSKRTIVNHNLKFDLKWLREEGLVPKGPVRCTMIEAHLYDENQPDKSLSALANNFTTLKNHKEGLLEYRKKNKCEHKDVPEEIMVPYGCADVDAALRLDQYFRPKLLERGQGPLLKLEGKAVKMFTEIEANGWKIDVDKVDTLVEHYETVIAEKEEVIKEIGGEEFNDRSPQQVYRILYDKWDLPPMGMVKPWNNKTGYDTTEYTLRRLVGHPRLDLSKKQKRFLETLLFLRENRKVLSTYLLGLSDHLRPGNFIHPWFRLDGTVTGRLSCRDINFQQIPREGPIKSLFISRYGSEGVILQFDLSQAELRFAAHVSREPTLSELFRRGGIDIHRAIAAEVLSKHPDDVSDEERKRAKTINFGILYGTSKWTLAEKMGCAIEVAARFLKKWKNRFPRWEEYEREVRKEVIANGQVVSPFGRIRHLPIMDPSSKQGKEALRQAINSPIQGGVADYTLHCGVEANRLRKKAGLHKCHFVAQVHDAWDIDCHKSQAKAMVEIMEETHNNPDLSEFGFQMSVPMLIETKVGPNWKELKPWS